ncbi:MAG: hypothetical protein HOP02_13595 [Methylococcaceae bacterium]|nr:hypothetical protein [Methylococcaceae bacterium]
MKKFLYILGAIIVGLAGYRFLNNSPLNQQQAQNNPTSILKLVADKVAPKVDMVSFRQNQIGFDLALDQIKPMATTKVNNQKINDIQNILNSTNQKNIEELDRAVSSLLQDKKIPRSDKISGLLNLVKEFGVDSEKGRYLLDALGSLRPIEIADNLIRLFNTPNALDGTKNQIMTILADSYGIDPTKFSLETAKLIAQQSIGIQDFFTQQIQNPTNGDVYRQAIKLYPSVSSETELALLNDSLIKHQDLIPIQESLSIRLDSSIVNAGVQKNLLPELLDNVQQGVFGADVKQEFNNRLYTALNAPNAEKIIADRVKPQLEAYIREQEPPLNIADADFNGIHNYSSWVEAYAKSANNGDKSAFIANYLAASASPIQQAAVIVSADGNLLYQIQKNAAIQNNMSSALADPNLPSGAKTIIQDAVQRLQASNQ